MEYGGKLCAIENSVNGSSASMCKLVMSHPDVAKQGSWLGQQPQLELVLPWTIAAIAGMNRPELKCPKLTCHKMAYFHKTVHALPYLAEAIRYRFPPID
ncbi:MAG: hypothetical protein CV081_06845 [Nitrospira sp. LK265]|nr:hypothetical protein [Nitrospira sp. LK265]